MVALVSLLFLLAPETTEIGYPIILMGCCVSRPKKSQEKETTPQPTASDPTQAPHPTEDGGRSSAAATQPHPLLQDEEAATHPAVPPLLYGGGDNPSTAQSEEQEPSPTSGTGSLVGEREAAFSTSEDNQPSTSRVDKGKGKATEDNESSDTTTPNPLIQMSSLVGPNSGNEEAEDEAAFQETDGARSSRRPAQGGWRPNLLFSPGDDDKIVVTPMVISTEA